MGSDNMTQWTIGHCLRVMCASVCVAACASSAFGSEEDAVVHAKTLGLVDSLVSDAKADEREPADLAGNRQAFLDVIANLKAGSQAETHCYHADGSEKWNATPTQVTLLLRNAKQVTLLHIPKAGGVSFDYDWERMHLHTKFNPGDTYRQEMCFGDKENTNHSRDVVLLRSPRAHIYSQYVMCRYTTFGDLKQSPFFQKHIAGTNMTVGFSKWLRFFETAPAGIAKGIGHCYDPRNLQTRALVCNRTGAAGSHRYWAGTTAKGALSSLDDIGVVGITELYRESKCLAVFSSTGSLPASCRCECAKQQQRTQTHDDHGLPKHPLSDLSPEIVAQMDQLTVMDRTVYQRAVKRLIADLQAAHLASGVRILCPGTLGRLMADPRLAYLGLHL
jgi:hypothetical protein